jgi:hypothetical protein
MVYEGLSYSVNMEEIGISAYPHDTLESNPNRKTIMSWLTVTDNERFCKG